MSQNQASSRTEDSLPFAVAPEHVQERVQSRWRNFASVAILAAILLLALSGLLGGGSSHHARAQAPGLAGELVYDPIVRSGNWYETTLDVEAGRPFSDLTVAIDEGLWSQMSIDTMAPDAESAEALNGRYAYHFGPVKAGERFRMKLDGQIQPGVMRRQKGAIRILDGEREVMRFPVTITVLP